jgi:hypothetical protein
MNNQDRVLIRRGARQLNEQEVEQVSGGLRTLTLCTISLSSTVRDGDTFLGEC